MAANTNYILGNQFLVYDSSSNALAFSTECTLTVSSDTIDCANKNLGYWAAALPGSISWSISTSCLYTSEAKYDDLFNKLVGHQAISFKFGQCKSLGDATNDASTAMDASKGYYEGTGYISSLELSASNNSVASYAIEITGNGPLTFHAGS